MKAARSATAAGVERSNTSSPQKKCPRYAHGATTATLALRKSAETTSCGRYPATIGAQAHPQRHALPSINKRGWATCRPITIHHVIVRHAVSQRTYLLL